MNRGSAMLSVLGAVLIIAILAVVLMNGGVGSGQSSRADGLGTTIPTAAKLKAQDTVCKENLRQVRYGVDIFRTSNDGAPSSIEETRLGATFYKCPIGKEPYTYDPATGTVTCPHPGHEDY